MSVGIFGILNSFCSRFSSSLKYRCYFRDFKSWFRPFSIRISLGDRSSPLFRLPARAALCVNFLFFVLRRAAVKDPKTLMRISDASFLMKSNFFFIDEAWTFILKKQLELYEFVWFLMKISFLIVNFGILSPRICSFIWFEWSFGRKLACSEWILHFEAFKNLYL